MNYYHSNFEFLLLPRLHFQHYSFATFGICQTFPGPNLLISCRHCLCVTHLYLLKMQGALMVKPAFT